MDWSKAKTILIIVFLVVNLALGHIYYSNYKLNQNPETSEEFITNVKNLLLEKGIEVEDDIPLKVPSLIPILVEYDTYDPDIINRLLFENKGRVTIDGKKAYIKYDGEEVLLENNKTLSYRNYKEENKDIELDKREGEKLTRDFLRQLKLDHSSMELIYSKEENGELKLIYSKSFEDIPLENSYLEVIIDKRGIKKLDRTWLNVVDKGDTEIQGTIASKAILDLISIKEAYNKKVIDISLCNYFDPLDQELLVDPGDAKKGKTIPAWRILFSDGTKIILDNH